MSGLLQDGAPAGASPTSATAEAQQPAAKGGFGGMLSGLGKSLATKLSLPSRLPSVASGVEPVLRVVATKRGSAWLKRWQERDVYLEADHSLTYWPLGADRSSGSPKGVMVKVTSVEVDSSGSGEVCVTGTALAPDGTVQPKTWDFRFGPDAMASASALAEEVQIQTDTAMQLAVQHGGKPVGAFPADLLRRLHLSQRDLLPRVVAIWETEGRAMFDARVAEAAQHRAAHLARARDSQLRRVRLALASLSQDTEPAQARRARGHARVEAAFAVVNKAGAVAELSSRETSGACDSLRHELAPPIASFESTIAAQQGAYLAAEQAATDALARLVTSEVPCDVHTHLLLADAGACASAEAPLAAAVDGFLSSVSAELRARSMAPWAQETIMAQTRQTLRAAVESRRALGSWLADLLHSRAPSATAAINALRSNASNIEARRSEVHRIRADLQAWAAQGAGGACITDGGVACSQGGGVQESIEAHVWHALLKPAVDGTLNEIDDQARANASASGPALQALASATADARLHALLDPSVPTGDLPRLIDELSFDAQRCVERVRADVQALPQYAQDEYNAGAAQAAAAAVSTAHAVFNQRRVCEETVAGAVPRLCALFGSLQADVEPPEARRYKADQAEAASRADVVAPLGPLPDCPQRDRFRDWQLGALEAGVGGYRAQLHDILGRQAAAVAAASAAVDRALQGWDTALHLSCFWAAEYAASAAQTAAITAIASARGWLAALLHRELAGLGQYASAPLFERARGRLEGTLIPPVEALIRARVELERVLEGAVKAAAHALRHLEANDRPAQPRLHEAEKAHQRGREEVATCARRIGVPPHLSEAAVSSYERSVGHALRDLRHTLERQQKEAEHTKREAERMVEEPVRSLLRNHMPGWRSPDEGRAGLASFEAQAHRLEAQLERLAGNAPPYVASDVRHVMRELREALDKARARVRALEQEARERQQREAAEEERRREAEEERRRREHEHDRDGHGGGGEHHPPGHPHHGGGGHGRGGHGDHHPGHGQAGPHGHGHGHGRPGHGH